MTIAELHTNEELRRHEFPVYRDKIFLGHGGVCPLPRRVAEAMSTRIEASTILDQEAALPPNFIADTRRMAAGLLHATPEEIAFVGPTSTALSYLAAGLNWRKGHNVLIYQDDYPSNVYPWLALAERGVEVRFLAPKELGRIRLVDIQFAVDENTKVVALASCHFISGWRLNLDAIGKWLRSRNVLFCVDGIQTLGAFPTTVENIDLLAADSHKWLLGPCAAGLMYVRRSLQDHLKPLVHGWHNVRCPGFVAQDDIQFRPDARRYEAGTQNLIGLAGLRAALALLEEVGVENIATELARKRAWVTAAIQEKGYEVLNPTLPAENTSGIVTFTRAGDDLAALNQRLANAGIVASLRVTRDKRQWLRFTPHYYNTDAELHRALELL
jgi:cysteine desulfurase/selenocysteine lyase